MKTRILAMLLAGCLLLMLLPLYAAADTTDIAMSMINVEDTVVEKVGSYLYGQLYTLDGEDGEKEPFQYAADGTTVLIFYGAGGCYNSKAMFEDLAQSEWAQDDSIHIVAVESSEADRDTVEQFMEDTGARDVVDQAYYHPTSNYLLWEYVSLIAGEVGGSGSSVRFSFVLLIESDENGRHIRYGLHGVSSAHMITQYLSQLTTITDAVPTMAEVSVPGVYHYEQVASVYEQVNAYREENGVAALTLNADLTALAMQRAAECALYYGHTRPNGESCFAVTVDGVEYSGSLTAENVAAGQYSADEVMTDWKQSPGHSANMLGTKSRQIGVGCFENAGTLYWVQLFGKGDDESVPADEPIAANAQVQVLSEFVQPQLFADEDVVTVAVDETVVLPPMYTLNQGLFWDQTTILLPTVVSVSDTDSGEALATVTYDEVGSGLVTLTGAAVGSGTVTLAAYDGQSNPCAVALTVRAPRALGDLDDDGDLDMFDALLLYRGASGFGFTGEQREAADYNGDGAINMMDAVQLYTHVAGG